MRMRELLHRRARACARLYFPMPARDPRSKTLNPTQASVAAVEQKPESFGWRQ